MAGDRDEQDWDELVASAYGANPFAKKPPKSDKPLSDDAALDSLRNAWLDADETTRKRFLAWLEEKFELKAVSMPRRKPRR